MRWTQFLTMPWEVLAATDVCTVEVATWHGRVTYSGLVVMELATRRVQMAGITPHPTAACMPQCVRQLTDPFEGCLRGQRPLMHDRDTQCTQACDGRLKERGREPVLLPPRSPNLHAHGARFVRSVREEALDRMRMLGERSRRSVIQQTLAHAHHERHHQGLGNQLIPPASALGSPSGRVQRRERLGGRRRYYDRDAA